MFTHNFHNFRKKNTPRIYKNSIGNQPSLHGVPSKKTLQATDLSHALGLVSWFANKAQHPDGRFGRWLGESHVVIFLFEIPKKDGS